MFEADSRVLITGGAGFIGSALCRHLILSTSCAVMNIDMLTYAASLQSLVSIENDPRYTFCQADVADRQKICRLINEFRPDTIVHLAAETHVDRSIDSAAPFIHSNIVGTFTLLEVSRAYWSSLPRDAQRTFRFILVSTDEVYGSLSQTGLPFTEQTPYDPSSPYAASKAAADHLAYAWYKTYGFPAIISNCSNNYGPFQFPEKLIPLAVLNALERKPIPVYGDGTNVRDWLFVEDHARALVKIFREGKPGEKYNVGARSERSNIEVVELICRFMDDAQPHAAPHASLVSYVTDRPGHDRRYAIDPSKIESELRWHPEALFEAALRDTVRWYLANRAWWEPIRLSRYTGERLGAGRDRNQL
jgi:dTDP-glucose 4,6-dehydratase